MHGPTYFISRAPLGKCGYEQQHDHLESGTVIAYDRAGALTSGIKLMHFSKHEASAWYQYLSLTRAARSYRKAMQTEPRSFSWSQDFDESLNFWFWLRRTEGIDDARLLERLNQWADEGALSVQQSQRAAFEHHLQVRNHERWREYLPIGQAWKRAQVEQHIEENRAQKASQARADYKSMAALGVRLRVQWVMAPFGERWLLPPDLAVMGVEGATAESRRKAVLEAARALASSSAAC